MRSIWQWAINHLRWVALGFLALAVFILSAIGGVGGGCRASYSAGTQEDPLWISELGTIAGTSFVDVTARSDVLKLPDRVIGGPAQQGSVLKVETTLLTLSCAIPTLSGAEKSPAKEKAMLVRILNPGKLQGNGEDGQRLLRAIREGKGPIEGVYSLTFLGTNTQLVSECNNRLLKYDLGCGGKKTLMMEIRNPSLWAVSFTPEVLLKDPGNSLQKGGITPFGYTGSEKKT